MTLRRKLLITGASRGIGAATAVLAGQKGYDVGINYRSDAAAAEKIVRELTRIGAEAIAIKADVSNGEDVEQMFDHFTRHFGRIDALVNSAGVSGNDSLVRDFDVGTLAKLFDTNVIGTLYCCREAARRMTPPEGTGGAIVNVSSMAAVIGGRARNSDYAASKAAVDAFTLGMSKEVSRWGIRVNAIRPGMTATDMTQSLEADPRLKRDIESTIAMQRIATADEIAKPILWLLSDEASFISGACLDASGGGFLIGSTSKSDK